MGFLFINEVYCLVFLFLCHHWFLLRQFVNLYISPVPPCWTLLLLVGNTDCVNLLHCSLATQYCGKQAAPKYWLCFLEPLCRSSDTRPDFGMRFPGGNWIFAIHRLFIYCCYFERQGKFSRKLSYSVLKRKKILLHAVFKCFGILVAHLHIEIKWLHSHPVVTFVFCFARHTSPILVSTSLFSSS